MNCEICGEEEQFLGLGIWVCENENCSETNEEAKK